MYILAGTLQLIGRIDLQGMKAYCTKNLGRPVLLLIWLAHWVREPSHDGEWVLGVQGGRVCFVWSILVMPFHTTMYVGI